MNACTIIARNYLPAARLLARSFLTHHPDSTFSILLLDAVERQESEEGFEVLSPYDIGIDRREVHRMAMIYDVKELATAVKPWLLQSLLARGSADVAVYFDPDIEIFAPLEDVRDLAREHAIVLTPHMLKPFPNDGLLPDDLMILQAGTYNLGFIAVGRDAGDFLDWWSAKLSRDCLVAVDRGQFVDQRWVDLVPALFDHVVLRDTACNVAYWNLHERTLRRVDGGYEVDGRPLRFFHFSGFDPRRPNQLSVHMGQWVRVDLKRQPDLARLCAEYAERVLGLGYAEHHNQTYRFDSTARGTAVDRRMRKIYREALEERRQRSPEPPDPFDPATAQAFLDWLQEPVSTGGISRYLAALYHDRPEVKASFPLVHTLHRRRFLKWVAMSGRHEENVPAELVPAVELAPAGQLTSFLTARRVRVEQRLHSAAVRHPVLRKATPVYFALLRGGGALVRRLSASAPMAGPGSLRLEVARTPTPGVNVAGYLRAELGIGEIARKLVAAIKYSGLPFATVTYGNTVSRQEVPFEEAEPNTAPYDTNIVCINADQLHVFARDAGQAFFRNRYTIGVWFWELEALPESYLSAFHLVDEIWVGSDFVRGAVASSTAKPVHVVPVPLDLNSAEPLDRASLSLPESFLYFFTFDFLSVVERKNPLAVLAAFKKAFKPGEGAALLIKCINGDRNVAALNRLRAAAAEHEDIHVIHGYLTPEANDQLMATCDCYVSLHRSEGLGLTMAEAMANGKPVIATAYSGNLAFMNDDNSYLVPYILVPVGKGAWPYPPQALWAEPEIGRAAEIMRHVYENRDEARERGMHARRDLATRHSLERTADFIVDRLDQIHAVEVAKRPRAEPVVPPA